MNGIFSDVPESQPESAAQTAPEETLVVDAAADDAVAEPVEQVEEADDAVEAPEAPVESDSEEAAPAEGIVTEEMVAERLRGLPGRWYVLHTYSGYEKRVKQDLEIRIHSMDMEDYIFQIEVPMEEIFEVKKGQRKLVSRVRMPGYALVRMDMTDDAWRVVQNTNGVTGFVGNGRTPVALTKDEVVKMLTPVVEQEAAHEAIAAGKPVAGGGPVTISEYEVGETVTLTTEPWVGMPATISQVDPVNQRLTVLMTLVGQETPVDLSFSQVKKAD